MIKTKLLYTSKQHVAYGSYVLSGGFFKSTLKRVMKATF